MFQPAKLSSILDIRDELRRDVCQLMFVNEAMMSLFNQDVDQEVMDGVSYTISHVLASLNHIDVRLQQMNIRVIKRT